MLIQYHGTLCDSIATLTLTINNSTSSTDSVGTHCDEYTWIDGITYTASIIQLLILIQMYARM